LNIKSNNILFCLKDFTREDYRKQITMALTYLQSVVISRPDKKIRVLWRETSAQHFPTPNGYWPGMKVPRFSYVII